MASRRKQKIQSRTELEETTPVPNKIPRDREIVIVENAVDFVGHCSFCLRLLNVYGTHIEGLAAPVENSSLTEFCDIWQYLQKNYLSDGKSPGCPSPKYVFITGMRQNGNPLYSQVPAMCSLCHEELVKLKALQEKLVDLLESLDSQVKSVQEIVLGCDEDGKSSWRGKQFRERLLDADVEDDRIANTLRFLDELRRILKRCSSRKFTLSSNSQPQPHQMESSSGASVVVHAPPNVDSDRRDKSPGSEDIRPEDEGSGMVSNYSHFGEEEIKSELDSDSEEEVKSEVNSEAGSDEEMMDVSSTAGESDNELEEELPNAVVATHKNFKEPQDPLADACFAKARKKKPRKTFKTMEYRKQHCYICNQIFPRGQMSQHLRSHVKGFVYECPNPRCKHAFISQYLLEQHFKTRLSTCGIIANFPKTGQRLKKCETCDYTTESLLTLRIHLQHHEASAVKSYTCPISGCEARFAVRQNVEYHLNSHKYKPPLNSQKCGNCSKQILGDKMEEHLKSDHSATEIFPCKQCCFIYSSRPLLIDHLYMHRKEGIVCDICGPGPDKTKFGRMRPLREHYFQVHKVGEKVLCEHCNQFFHTTKGLKIHIDCHHGPEAYQKKELMKLKTKNRKFKCEICFDAVEFKSEDILTRHKINEHGADPFSCDICDEKFNYRVIFLQHKKSHEGIETRVNKEKTCEDCGKIFLDSKRLSYHWKREHSGETHVCDICGKTYLSRQSLVGHKTRVHSGIVHICDVCGDKFNTPQSLRRHQLIHTGERPYRCEICGTQFRQRGVLKTHMKSHERLGDKFVPRPTFDRKRKEMD